MMIGQHAHDLKQAKGTAGHDEICQHTVFLVQLEDRAHLRITRCFGSPIQLQVEGLFLIARSISYQRCGQWFAAGSLRSTIGTIPEFVFSFPLDAHGQESGSFNTPKMLANHPANHSCPPKNADP
jgi:hypothetical protein